MEQPGDYDITISQGAGFLLPFRYEAPEGSPVDFTGSTAKMQARTKFGAKDVLFELSTSDGTITLSSDGHVQLSEPALVTAVMRFGQAVYDLFITPPGGEPYKLLKGNIFLDLRVTEL